MTHWFACEIEEVVRPDSASGRSVRRLDRGFARGEGNLSRGFAVEASTEPFDDILRALSDGLVRPPAPDLGSIQATVSARSLTRVSATSTGGPAQRETVQVIALSAGGLTLVATPASLASDLETLERLVRREPVERADPDALPIAWQNGSAAVLFHEVIGHPAERGYFPTTVPPWLEVIDAPDSGDLVAIGTDDTGAPVSRETLTARARPAALRRWSHRDLPSRRLTNLVCRGTGESLDFLPGARIDALLVDEGWWDPSTDVAGVRVVAADLVDGRHRRPLEPFVYVTRREEAFSLLLGWFGEVCRHPGVICSDEGVPLPVGSASVGVVTGAR